MSREFLKARLATKFISILPMTRWHGLKAMALRAAGISVGKNVEIWSTAKFYGANIFIGNDCFIGYGAQFFPTSTSEIRIGDGCDIGTEVIIHVGGHKLGPSSRRAGKGYSKPILIESGVRISTRSIILEGAKIGAGAQIAAGSVVIKDVPPNNLYGGVPAKYLKSLPENGDEAR